MKKQSSYIFLEHPSKEKKDDTTPAVEIGNSVYSFIKKTFPSIKDVGNEKDRFFRQCETKLNKCTVIFVLHYVSNIVFLDITVEGKTTSQIISCLEQVQDGLLNSGIRSYYVEIISYDAISEYYCNKIVGKLNNLERNLRKLLFNIYILHFEKDYYQATMNTDLQNKIKGLINSATTKENKDRIGNDYNVNGKDIDTILRLQQFFYSFELADIQMFLFNPNWTSIDERAKAEFLSSHQDLSALTDGELRKAFSQFTPQTDWDRFFSSKIHIDNISELINNIRNYRNSIAHFKFFDRNDYKTCNQMIIELNRAIIQAIKITEKIDFAIKNAEIITNTLSRFMEEIHRFAESIAPMIQKRLSQNIRSNLDLLRKAFIIPFENNSSDSNEIEDQENDKL